MLNNHDINWTYKEPWEREKEDKKFHKILKRFRLMYCSNCVNAIKKLVGEECEKHLHTRKKPNNNRIKIRCGDYKRRISNG